jgi:hypothetical protein
MFLEYTSTRAKVSHFETHPPAHLVSPHRMGFSAQAWQL